MAKHIVGIGGKKRAGKNTLADYIEKYAHTYRAWAVEQVSFAQPIKEMLQTVFKHEVPLGTFIDDSRKKDKVEIAPGAFMTVRELLQKVGTDCFRDIIHRDFWIHRGLAKIQASAADIVIVPDVRFANEMHLLNEVGTTIYIERPDTGQDSDQHPSEKELDTIKGDFELFLSVPTGRMDMIEQYADEFVQRLL